MTTFALGLMGLAALSFTHMTARAPGPTYHFERCRNLDPVTIEQFNDEIREGV